MKSVGLLMLGFVLLSLNVLAVGYSKGYMLPKASTRNTCVGQSRLRNPSKLSLKWGLVDRFWSVIRGQLNTFLSYFETPEKVIEQAIEEMDHNFVRLKLAYAELSASYQQALNRRNNLQNESLMLFTKAGELINAKQEGLAKQALYSHRQIISQLDKLDKQIEIQSSTLTKLKESMEASQIKLTEVKREKDALIVRAKIAETTVQANELIQSLSDDATIAGANQAYSRIKQKVSASEAKAEVSTELTGLASSSFERRYQDFQIQQNVENDFNALKAKSNLPKEKKPV